MTLVYRSMLAAGLGRAAWRLSASRLRILCYHGVCDERLAAEPWVPTYFVTRASFERQLRYLARNASVLPLFEAVQRLREGALPPRAVSLTFDDGYANNLSLAAPLLGEYGMRATVFLTTKYIESGGWYPSLRLKLLRLHRRDLELPPYKTTPVDEIERATAPYWPEVEASLSPDQRDTLRPLTVDEVRAAGPLTLEFGAHSHTHGIPRNETADRRREEIRISIEKVAQWTGRPVRVFSYPNGEAGDFDDIDKNALRAAGVTAAVSGIAGSNRRDGDLLELRRYPVSLYHDEWRFEAEVTGVRTALRSVSRMRH